MSDLVFIDTGGWFAGVVPWDANHTAAALWFRRNESPLLTTDYVLDETMTLLRARGEGERALALGERLFAGELAILHYLTAGEVQAAWQVFRRFRDKEWSFTDCTSKMIIEQLGCVRALAFDEHFRQFGTLLVEP